MCVEQVADGIRCAATMPACHGVIMGDHGSVLLGRHWTRQPQSQSQPLQGHAIRWEEESADAPTAGEQSFGPESRKTEPVSTGASRYGVFLR